MFRLRFTTCDIGLLSVLDFVAGFYLLEEKITLFLLCPSSQMVLWFFKEIGAECLSELGFSIQ